MREINDRFTNGFIAGSMAGAVISVTNYILHKVGIVDLLYLDWVTALLYGHLHKTVFEAVIGQAGKLFFSGLLGSLFAFWLTKVTGRFLNFKGIVFGIAVWFGVHAAVTLFKLTPLIPIKAANVFPYKIEAVIFGVILAELMRRLSAKQEKCKGD